MCQRESRVLIDTPLRSRSPVRWATRRQCSKRVAVNFPDALSAVPAAVALHGAIVLTDGFAQAAATSAYLAAHATSRYAVGGPAAYADPSAIGVRARIGMQHQTPSRSRSSPRQQESRSHLGRTSRRACSWTSRGHYRQPVLLVPGTGACPNPSPVIWPPTQVRSLRCRDSAARQRSPTLYSAKSRQLLAGRPRLSA